MTLCGESRMNLEAARPNTLLGKRAVRMGTWNVRTMYATGTTFQVAADMRAYNLALLGISETRWTQSEKAFDGVDRDTLWKLIRHYDAGEDQQC